MTAHNNYINLVIRVQQVTNHHHVTSHSIILNSVCILLHPLITDNAANLQTYKSTNHITVVPAENRIKPEST